MDDDAAICALLLRFCEAMNCWELAMNDVRRRWKKDWRGRSSLPESHPYWREREEAKQQLSVVFKEYCTEWDSPGRAGSFASPPDYDPEHFDILEVKVRGKKATARVQEKYIGDPIIYTYHLRKTEDGWRLEDRRDYMYPDGGTPGKTTL